MRHKPDYKSWWAFVGSGLLLLVLLWGVAALVGWAQTELTSQIATDDADWSLSPPADLGWGDYGGTSQKSSFLFAISIPSGSTIDSSWLVVYANGSDTDPIDVELYCEDTQHPTVVTDETDYDSRTKTTASTNISGLSSWTHQEWYRVPEAGSYINGPIQEVADLGAIDSLQIMVQDEGSSPYNDVRYIYDYSNHSSFPCSLIVWYSTGGGGSVSAASAWDDGTWDDGSWNGD